MKETYDSFLYEEKGELGYKLSCSILITEHEDYTDFSLEPILLNGVACDFIQFGLVDRLAKKALEAYRDDYNSKQVCLDT
jgi:hypothetical protein